jgi:predicted small secreted protein
MKRFIQNLIVLSAVCVLLGACNTVEGIGKDVKKVGEKVEDAAK